LISKPIKSRTRPSHLTVPFRLGPFGRVCRIWIDLRSAGRDNPSDCVGERTAVPEAAWDEAEFSRSLCSHHQCSSAATRRPDAAPSVPARAAGVYNVTVWPPSEITRRSGRQRQIKYHRFNGRPPPELSSSSAASSLPKMSGFAPSSGSRRWG